MVSEGRLDLMPLKLKVFEAISSRNRAGEGAVAPAAGGGTPPCKLWSVYRNGFRLYLLGELTKPELDAIVLYTLGMENVHLHNDLVRAVLHNSSLPKPPLLETVMPYFEQAMKLPSRRPSSQGNCRRTREGDQETQEEHDDENDEGEEEDDDDDDEEEEEGLRFSETLRRVLHRHAPVWNVWQPMMTAPGLVLPLPPLDEQENMRAALSLLPPPSSAASRTEADADGSSPPSRLATSTSINGESGNGVVGGDGEPQNLSLKRKAQDDGDDEGHPTQVRRTNSNGSSTTKQEQEARGDAMEEQGSPGAEDSEEREEHQGHAEEKAGEVTPSARLPTLPLVHHILCCAGGLEQQFRASIQATMLLNEAAQDFAQRILRRCVSVVKAGRPDSAGHSHEQLSSSGLPTTKSSTTSDDDHPTGGGENATSPAPTPAPPSPPCAVLPRHARREEEEEQMAVIDASTVLQALRVPSNDARDPIGRSFPPPELMDDLYCMTYY